MTHVSKPLQEALRTIKDISETRRALKAYADTKRIEALERIVNLYRDGYTIEADYAHGEYERVYGRTGLDIEEE